jgi:DNA-binding transcriptional LysR family regulator
VNADLQRHALAAADLALVLALVRGGNLARAGALAGVDGSTVFRTVQRAEKALGQRLFERSRAGYRATDLGLRIAQHAERIEAELEAAQTAVAADAGAAAGSVRVSLTDTVLHGLVLPALGALLAAHPLLAVELSARNEFANLTQREADIALRATLKPPPHLVGRRLGPIRVVACAARHAVRQRPVELAAAPWIAVDDALPEHPSVRWRRRHLPQVVPRVLTNSILGVHEAVALGLGVGILPLFLVRASPALVALTEPLAEVESQLWMLTHPESRHLRRIATVAAHLAQAIALD